MWPESVNSVHLQACCCDHLTGGLTLLAEAGRTRRGQRPCSACELVVRFHMAQEIETTADKVGSVSASRYEEIVALLREVVENQTRGQFTIGDAALEIEPMREPGGSGPADEMFSVKQSLARLAEDIGLSYSSIKDTRWTASRWPKDRRQPK